MILFEISIYWFHLDVGLLLFFKVLLCVVTLDYSQIGTTTITAHSALARSYNRDLQAENDVLRKDLL